MPEDIWPYLIPALASAIAGIIGGRYTIAKSRLEKITAPYTALAERLVAVEAELATQRGENLQRREENSQIRKENAVIRRRLKDLSRDYAEARAEARADREYIADAAPWIAAHAHYATYRPPVPPAWYQAPDTGRPQTRPREYRAKKSPDDEEDKSWH